MVNESNISRFISNSDLDKKIATLATKAELKTEQNKIVKLQAFDSGYFRCKNYFVDDETQNYLVFQPVLRYFKRIANSNNISLWKSEGLSDESIKRSAASNNSLAPSLNYINTKMQVKCDGTYLKQEKSHLLIKK